MDLLRTLVALLCLPALLAPSGYSGVVCLCDEWVAGNPVESCCEIAKRSCCCAAATGDEAGDEAGDVNDGAPAEAHAPCASCRDLSTPDAPAARAPSSQHETLDPALLLPLPKSFAMAIFDDAPRRAALRPIASHAPPPTATDVPLRI